MTAYNVLIFAAVVASFGLQPAFRYRDWTTGFLLSLFVQAACLYIGIHLLERGALRPPVSMPCSAVAALAGTFFNYVAGTLLPFGFPFCVVELWAIASALRCVRVDLRTAGRYAAVPVAIAAAYAAGGRFASTLEAIAVASAPGGVALPHGHPEIVAYQIDAPGFFCDCRRFIVRDESHSGASRASLLLRKAGGLDCDIYETATIAPGYYDMSRVCGAPSQ
ncbi:MAG TPA: hypothetical protein VGF18_05320 [Candidatus Tumulicola sp.]|jgi:hypothetical protein